MQKILKNFIELIKHFIKQLQHFAKRLPISKKMGIFITVLVVVFGGLVVFNWIRGYMSARFFASYEPAPVTVSTSIAKVEDWQSVLQAVGHFVATQGVEVTAEIGGTVKEILFRSGQYVKQGTPLVIIDDSVDQAELKNNQSNLALQKVTYERQLNLQKRGATSTSDVDQSRANLQQAEAAVEQVEATIAQKHIDAPFDGRLGIRRINLGEYVTPGTTNIVNLQSLNPLYLFFFLPEQDFPLLYKNQTILFSVDAFPNRIFKGKINALDSKIDTNTHNILIQAIVSNCLQQQLNTSQPSSSKDGAITECSQAMTTNEDPHFAFVPGMFADIEVLLKQQTKAIVLPVSAIAYTLYGDSVYVVKQEGKDKAGQPLYKVYRRYVKVGEKRGNQAVILDGVKEGEQIVNSGQLKLRDGTRVAIDNRIPLTTADNIDELGQ